jgi:hypothetical protein
MVMGDGDGWTVDVVDLAGDIKTRLKSPRGNGLAGDIMTRLEIGGRHNDSQRHFLKFHCKKARQMTS